MCVQRKLDSFVVIMCVCSAEAGQFCCNYVCVQRKLDSFVVIMCVCSAEAGQFCCNYVCVFSGSWTVLL